MRFGCDVALPFLRRLAADWFTRSALRALLAAEKNRSLFCTDDGEVMRQLAFLLESGRMRVAIRSAAPATVPTSPVSEVAQAAEAVGTAPDSTWVEIVLVDEQGRGVHQDYELIGPSGESLRGSTNANGFARVEQLKRGAWKVTFPNLDAQGWGPE
jgi:hypothetical protein